MAKHVKPTPEELEANAMKALEEAEALKNSEKPEEKPEETPEDDNEEAPNTNDTPDDSEEKPDDTDDDDDSSDDTPPVKPNKQEEDLQAKLAEKDKKLKASSREAQILYHRNKQVQEAIEKASQLADPTEDEMKAEYEDWDVMSEFEKKMARQAETSNRRLNAITDVSKGFKDLEEWQGKVDSFVDNPETLISNPALEGRVEEFKDFATKPTRRGVDFEILVSSFLYQIDTTKPAKNKTKMFPKGGGGQNKPKPTSNKLTVEQGKSLRLNNYAEYKRQLQAGNIESDF